MPYAGECGVSKKIEDKKERQRLRKIIEELTIPEGMGIIIRTAGNKDPLFCLRLTYVTSGMAGNFRSAGQK
jgi:ribonuclease G